MSASMIIDLPDGLTNCKLPDGREFKIDLVEAHAKINEISAMCKQKGETNFEYVDHFIAWVKEKTKKPDGTSIELNKGQADFFIDRILCMYADEKKAVSASLSSVSSTDQPSGS